jgi:predicted ABC-type sugar transport system permease subunit
VLDGTGAVNAHLALEINLARVEAEIGMKDYARATHDLDQELANAQRAGVRFALARIYYLLGTCTRLGGSAVRAADFYSQAARLLDVVSDDAGAENILHRTDVKTMWDESNRWKRQ